MSNKRLVDQTDEKTFKEKTVEEVQGFLTQRFCSAILRKMEKLMKVILLLFIQKRSKET